MSATNNPPFEIAAAAVAAGSEHVEGVFHWRAEAWSWGALPADALATDATIRLEVASADFERAQCAAYIHTRLERAASRDRWVIPVGAEQAEEIVLILVYDGWLPRLGPPHEQDGVDSVTNLAEAEFMFGGQLPKTLAHQWPGAAFDVLTLDLRLPSHAGMQDWPLEVSDGDRLEEFLAYYDRSEDEDVRFDAMALALFSFDERQRCARTLELERWFDARLRRDFFLHGHLVRDWSRLELPVLNGGTGFAISEQMRRVYWDSLLPLDTA